MNDLFETITLRKEVLDSDIGSCHFEIRHREGEILAIYFLDAASALTFTPREA